MYQMDWDIEEMQHFMMQETQQLASDMYSNDQCRCSKDNIFRGILSNQHEFGFLGTKRCLRFTEAKIWFVKLSNFQIFLFQDVWSSYMTRPEGVTMMYRVGAAMLLAMSPVTVDAGLLGAGEGEGSCAAPPFRAHYVKWTQGCPAFAPCCSEYGFCRPLVSNRDNSCHSLCW